MIVVSSVDWEMQSSNAIVWIGRGRLEMMYTIHIIQEMSMS